MPASPPPPAQEPAPDAAPDAPPADAAPPSDQPSEGAGEVGRSPIEGKSSVSDAIKGGAGIEDAPPEKAPADPTPEATAPPAEDLTDEQLVDQSRERLAESDTGREILGKADGVDVQVVDQGSAEVEEGAGAVYSDDDNTIYVLRDQIQDPTRGAVLLAHEYTHAIDEAETPTSEKFDSTGARILGGLTSAITNPLQGKNPLDIRDLPDEGQQSDQTRGTEANAYHQGAVVAQELGAPDQASYGMKDDGTLRSREEIVDVLEDEQSNLYGDGQSTIDRYVWDAAKWQVGTTVGAPIKAGEALVDLATGSDSKIVAKAGKLID